MEAFQHELTTLVKELRPDTAEALFTLLVDALDGLPRPDGVADHRRLEKPAALLDEYEAVDALAPRRGAEGGQVSGPTWDLYTPGCAKPIEPSLALR